MLLAPFGFNSEEETQDVGNFTFLTNSVQSLNKLVNLSENIPHPLYSTRQEETPITKNTSFLFRWKAHHIHSSQTFHILRTHWEGSIAITEPGCVGSYGTSGALIWKVTWPFSSGEQPRVALQSICQHSKRKTGRRCRWYFQYFQCSN